MRGRSDGLPKDDAHATGRMCRPDRGFTLPEPLGRSADVLWVVLPPRWSDATDFGRDPALLETPSRYPSKSVHVTGLEPALSPVEGAPHRRSAAGLPGPDLSREGVQAAIVGRSVSGGNQRTDRPPFDLLHHLRPNELVWSGRTAVAFPFDRDMTSPQHRDHRRSSVRASTS